MIRQFKTSPVTMGLLSVTVLVFLAMQVIFFGQATTGYAVLLSGGFYGELVKQLPQESWRLLSPIFVHIGWEHFILNSLTLYFVGRMAESLFGSGRFLILYLLSGLMGNLFTFLLSPSVIAAGASTSLFGLFAAISLLGYFGHNPYLKQLGRQYQVLIGLNLVFNLFSPDVSMAGHVGGAVGGLLCAVFLSNLLESQIFKSSLRFQALVAYVIISVSFFALAMFL